MGVDIVPASLLFDGENFHLFSVPDCVLGVESRIEDPNGHSP